MLEQERRLWRRSLSENEAGGSELVEQGVKLGFAAAGNRGEQVIGEPAADHRTDLRQLLGWAEPVEPARERGMQRRRDVMRQ
jgi:hypothetical protein